MLSQEMLKLSPVSLYVDGAELGSAAKVINTVIQVFFTSPLCERLRTACP